MLANQRRTIAAMGTGAKQRTRALRRATINQLGAATMAALLLFLGWRAFVVWPQLLDRSAREEALVRSEDAMRRAEAQLEAKYRTDTQQKDHGTEEDLPAFDGRVQAPALTHADVAPTRHTAPGACGRDSTFDVPDVALGHKVTRRTFRTTGASWAMRLKAGLRYAHMVSVATLPNGSLALAFQAAETAEGAEDQRVMWASSTGPSAEKFYEPRPLPLRRRGAQWGPVLHVVPKPKVPAGFVIHLFYAESKGCIRPVKPPKWPPGGDIKYTSSIDGGRTWRAARTILAQESEHGNIPKVVANHLVVTASGAWVLPFWRERAMLDKTVWPKGSESCRTEAEAYAGILVSEDGGATWSARGAVRAERTWLIENSVVEVTKTHKGEATDPHLLMLFRSHEGHVWSSRSFDSGFTWATPEAVTSLPNPDAKVSALTLQPSGDIVLAFNDHTRLKGWDVGHVALQTEIPEKARTDLTLALSRDGGHTWSRIGAIETVRQPGLRLHYPWIVQVGCELVLAYSKFFVRGYDDRGGDRGKGAEALGIRVVRLTAT